MKLSLYSIRDIQQSQCMRPMAMVNDGDASRQMTEIVTNTDPQNLIAKYPDHFEILHVGFFETDTGKIEASEPRSLGTATTFKPK